MRKFGKKYHLYFYKQNYILLVKGKIAKQISSLPQVKPQVDYCMPQNVKMFCFYCSRSSQGSIVATCNLGQTLSELIFELKIRAGLFRNSPKVRIWIKSVRSGFHGLIKIKIKIRKIYRHISQKAARIA